MNRPNSRSFPPDTATAGVVLSRGKSQTLRLGTLGEGLSAGRMYHGMYNTSPQNNLFTLLVWFKATDIGFGYTENGACCGWSLRCAGTGKAGKTRPGTTTPLPDPHPATTYTRYWSKISGENWEGVK